MSGLLSGVLPTIFSQADRAKRYLGGLLSDPVGRMQQSGGQAVDDLTKIGLLTEQAFTDKKNPMRPTDNAAYRQLVDTYLNSVMNFAPVGMFVGPKSATWDNAAADKAQTLAQKGVDPRQIWKETGTFKGPDGMWRQEIDDSAAVFEKPFRLPTSREVQDAIEAQDFLREITEAKKAAQNQHGYSLKEFYDSRPGDYDKYLKASEAVRKYNRDFVDPKMAKGELSKFLHHQEAFKAYPDTSQIPTTYKQDHSGGAYMPNMNQMLIGQGQEKSIALHELQHAIQGKEGWAAGGSPDDAALMPYVRKFYADNIDKFDGESHQLINMAKHRAYQNLSGEAEARAVQARMNMNMHQRRELFPLDSYDVPLDQLILRR